MIKELKTLEESKQNEENNNYLEQTITIEMLEFAHNENEPNENEPNENEPNENEPNENMKRKQISQVQP